MPNRRRTVRVARPRYPNQWRKLRTLRGYSKYQVAEKLGHEDEKYYLRIETGERFPGPRILFILLALMRVELRQAYPRLATEAALAIDTKPPQSGSTF